jgi:Trypsin-like peptidase domain
VDNFKGRQQGIHRIKPRALSPSTATASNPTVLVAICNEDSGEPVGAGVVVPAPVGQLSVLTCAHVVSAALQLPASPSRPWQKLRLRPWAAPEQDIYALVRQNGWFPADDEGHGDVAILQLLGEWPTEVVPARLAEWSMRTTARWQAFGYPAKYKRVGQHATGRFIGWFGPGNEWVQIDAEVVVGYRIVPGFSGSPVWEIDQNAVVGIAVSEDSSNPSARSGGMLPIEVAARYWEPLNEHIRRRGRNRIIALHRSSLTENNRCPPAPTQVSFTATNSGASVVKITSLRCRVVGRKPWSYNGVVFGIPDRYKRALRIDRDHDTYELLDRAHVLKPLETEEYAIEITADGSGVRYQLALEVSWQAVDGSDEGVAFLDSFFINH